MAAYVKTRVPHKYLPSSTPRFKRFHGQRPTISHLQPFESKYYVHIREDERISASKHLPLLDFGGYFLTLLFIADSHFTFHNFFILYATHVLDSGGILCFCLCIPTVLTM
jgi:hypothetical protein